MRWKASQGSALIEVLISGFILSIAIIGLALMFSSSSTFMVAEGDTRVALYLAQQKVERLRGLGFSAAKLDGVTGHLNYADGTANSGCGTTASNNEPCYNETVQAGAGSQTSSGADTDKQTFTRLTCVRYVRDDNPELPADVLSPPSAWTCPACTPLDPATDPVNCGATNDQSCCSQSTKRIKVAVIPTLRGVAGDPTAVHDSNRAILEIVLTPTAKP